MLSFIQKESKSVANLKLEIKKDQQALSEKFNEEAVTYNQILSKNNNSLTFLADRIVELKKELEYLKEGAVRMENHNKLVSAKVEKIDSAKEMSAGKIDAGSIVAGSLFVDGKVLRMRSDTEITVGDNKVSAFEIFEGINFIRKIRQICGKDFSKCKIMNRKEYEMERTNDEEILRNVRKLREDSQKALAEMVN